MWCVWNCWRSESHNASEALATVDVVHHFAEQNKVQLATADLGVQAQFGIDRILDVLGIAVLGSENGKPVEKWGKVSITFKLESEAGNVE